jgi:DnaJ-class molecular chaperone
MSNSQFPGRDYYELLGVDRGATEINIKKAYRRIAMRFNVGLEKGTHNAADFRQVSAAYEILSDPETRRVYDRSGHEGLSLRGWNSENGVWDSVWDRNEHNEYMDIFNQMFGNVDWFRSTSRHMLLSYEQPNTQESP